MRSVTGGSKRDKRRRSLLEQGGVDEIITQLSLCLSHTRAVLSMSVSVHMCECAYLLERMYTYALVYAHFWLPSNVAFYFSACTHAICVCADTLCVEWWLHSPFWNVWPCLLGWKWSFEHLLCFAISSIYTRLFFCVCVYTYIYIYIYKDNFVAIGHTEPSTALQASRSVTAHNPSTLTPATHAPTFSRPRPLLPFQRHRKAWLIWHMPVTWSARPQALRHEPRR